jgi:hypothetical protein
MKQRKVIPMLLFKTIKDGEKTYCGVRASGKPLVHRFVKERNSHGHDPGYVYLTYLPKGPYNGCYHIGKVEYTKIGTDDFDLDEIDRELLGELQRRLSNYHPGQKGTDIIYDGAQFVHGIRVACGEGAEKQPHSFFRLKKCPQVDRELFNLTETEIKIFKKAKGSILGREIKHLTADVFASYLANQGLSDETIHEWVVLPDNKKITVSRLKKYLVKKNGESSLLFQDKANMTKFLAEPNMKTSPAITHIVFKGAWYVVDGMQGTELPTLFIRCIKSLRQNGAVHVMLRKDIDADDKILRFKNHWRYQDYTKRYRVNPEEWQKIFMAVRGAKKCKKDRESQV